MNVIGIDLGTTNSEVAVIDEQGRPRILTIDGSPLVPSVVALDGSGEVLVGQAAVNAERLAPERCVRWVKRLMGSGKTLDLGGREWTPAMVSSRILAYLKAAAEVHLGAEVRDAVITVPAFFSERARTDTREAAELAGLNVLRLLNEPTAAAAAYAMGQRRDERWLVYDLGGGTFDVSIVDCSDAVMEVLASHGDTHLGGHDIDQLVAAEAVRSFDEEHHTTLLGDATIRNRVYQAAELAKIRLSDAASATVREEFLLRDAGGVDRHLDHRIDRVDFETLIAPLVERSLGSVRQALADAACTAADLARVILVGGATRTPLVRRRLREELGIDPQAWLDPDRVVARGAVIEAAALGGHRIGAEMVDITPHSLGTLAMESDGRVSNCILIHRNTPLPCVASELFYKAAPDQDRIIVEVVQGESRDPQHTTLLGSFPMEGLAADPRCDIHTRFELDRSGLLRVVVEHLGSGTSTEQVIERATTVRNAAIGDLPSARLDESAVGLGVFDDEDADHVALPPIAGTDADEDAPDLAMPGAAGDDYGDELRARAEALLTDGELDGADHEELATALRDLDATPDATTRDRLAELLYFME